MRTRMMKAAAALLLLAGTGLAVSACDTYAGTLGARTTTCPFDGPKDSPYQREQSLSCRANQENIARNTARQQTVAQGN